MVTHEWALFLVEGENVALQIEHGCVGSSTALPWTAVHIPFWGVSFHVLLKVISALKRPLTYGTGYVLWEERHMCNQRPMSNTSGPVTTHKPGTSREMSACLTAMLASNPSSLLMAPSVLSPHLARSRRPRRDN